MQANMRYIQEAIDLQSCIYKQMGFRQSTDFNPLDLQYRKKKHIPPPAEEAQNKCKIKTFYSSAIDRS